MITLKIAPSLLACDFSKIGEEAKRIELAGADFLHLDIMDGHFVPNISFGPVVVQAVRNEVSMPFDIHLMLSDPINCIDDFAVYKPEYITFHIEANSDIRETINKIKSTGVRPGLVIKPRTPVEKVFPYLDDIGMVLIMTVEPGFGGQKFMMDMLPKIRSLKSEISRRGLPVLIEVDGGIRVDTIALAADAGADVAVSGTGVFRAPDAAAAIKELKEKCTG